MPGDSIDHVPSCMGGNTIYTNTDMSDLGGVDYVGRYIKLFGVCYQVAEYLLTGKPSDCEINPADITGNYDTCAACCGAT
jgi:uncharacterized protein YbcC (UPF0753/DUF2309 family)